MDELGNRYVVGGHKREIQRWTKPMLASTSSPATAPPASASSGITAVIARPTPPSRFESIGRGQDGSIQIVLEGHPDAVYVIESSVDLNIWIPVSTNRVAGGQLLIEDPAAANIPVRFFRVRQPSGGNLD